jgi:hypothetical protein
MIPRKILLLTVGVWGIEELGVGSWELGVGSWELGNRGVG